MSRQLVRGDPKPAIPALIAGNSAEQVAIEARHELRERRATRRVEPSLTHVPDRRLGRVERQGAAALELEHEGDEPVRQRFHIPPGTRQLLRPRAVTPRIRHLAPADSLRPYRPRP